ncbi:MAG: tripeptide aminopeptidase PepT [Treponema sp.]|nr:tripeptide aminopeptidase PepT [Treponema sp.]
MNYIYNSNQYANELLERFLRYVKIWTESDGEAADKGVFPSTQRQFDLARVLEQELKSLGLEQVQVTEDCYVYGFLKENVTTSGGPSRASGTTAGLGSPEPHVVPEPVEGALNDPILFLAHMDTVDEVSGKDVKPVLEKLTGSDGNTDTIIRSDGTTLLGGDDKAGVAAIMSALAYLKQNPDIKHRPVEVIFSPDEETGHGMDRVPLKLIKSKYAYTVDGGSEGELESECFNAWAAEVEFTGKACHTGDAKAGGMINANLMASDFASLLPRDKMPETTEGYQGFIALMETRGGIEKATMSLLLRAFNIEEIEQEKQLLEENARIIQQKYGSGAKVYVKFKQQYLNMKAELDKHPQVVAQLEQAYKDSGVQIIRKPIRGGTDGSRLTEMGIPTPNIFTGGHEFHSRNEWVSLNSMCKAADVLINLLS